MMLIYWGKRMYYKVLVVSSKKFGLDINADKSKYMVTLKIRMLDEVTE